MEANTLTQDRQQLQELVGQYSDESRALPYLRANAEESWLQKAWEACREWGSEWLEWLRATTGPLPTIGSWHVDWELTARIVFWGCAILVVCGLVWWLVKKGLAMNLVPTSRSPLPKPLLTAEERLSQQLLAAVEAENWGRAARLRWRLFLCRIEAQPHLTPNELFTQAIYSDLWETYRGVPLHEQYQVMFAGLTGSQQWYDQYHGGLVGLEGSQRHE